MKHAIHIGGRVDAQTVKATAKSIKQVFKAGHKYHMDQETVRHALSHMPKADVSNVSIHGASIINEEK